MNEYFRKVALGAATLGLLLSLFLALRPGEVLPSPAAVTVRIEVPSRTAPTVRRYSVERQRQVVIVVTAELSDDVHLHGYDLKAAVGPGRPATLRFAATAAGRFELELEERGLELADLDVSP